MCALFLAPGQSTCHYYQPNEQLLFLFPQLKTGVCGTRGKWGIGLATRQHDLERNLESKTYDEPELMAFRYGSYHQAFLQHQPFREASLSCSAADVVAFDRRVMKSTKNAKCMRNGQAQLFRAE
jgi:hypothetical protein